jgi:predicted HD superfamily hydrolase involved in NAD metabolism
MQLDRPRVLAWLRREVSPERLAHILGVEELAAELATLHGANPQQAAVAGLLHDLAKFFPPRRLLRLARQEQLPLDPILKASPHLLHAEISAVIARQEFGVKNAKILSAIRCHTLGQPRMGKLAVIVFVADALEPQRGHSEVLERMRYTARHNLPRALRQTCDYTLGYLLAQNKTIHPRLLETRNWALKAEKKHISKNLS